MIYGYHSRFLLRKLLHYQSLTDGTAPSLKTPSNATSAAKPAVASSSETTEAQPAKSKPKAKKKAAAVTVEKKKMAAIPSVAKEILGLRFSHKVTVKRETLLQNSF